MEVEAIVINGKRYTPCKGASCAECNPTYEGEYWF